jgi:hypothetical protein
MRISLPMNEPSGSPFGNGTSKRTSRDVYGLNIKENGERSVVLVGAVLMAYST